MSGRKQVTITKYFEMSKNVLILRSQKTQNFGHWTAAQVVYLKQISGPYRLHRSILSSQTVYTPIQRRIRKYQMIHLLL